MQNTTAPFRADEVGSLLRTAPLKDARAKREKGQITPDQLRKVEDDEIRRVALGPREGLGAIRRRQHRVAARLQHVGEQLHVARRVVDDQDSRRVVHPRGRSRSSRTAARNGLTLIGFD